MPTFSDRPEKMPGYGQHFLKFCPEHCPCGYPCKTVIGEDGRWRPPPMRVIGWTGTGNRHSWDLPVE